MKRDQQRSIRQRWRDYRKRRAQRSRDELVRLTPTRVQLFWGALGLIVGIIATVIVLLVIAPEPTAVVVKPPSTNSDVAITLDDAAVSNLTAAGIAQANLPFTVTNLHDHILPNNVVQITGDVPLFGGVVTRRLSAMANLAVEQGHVVLHIQKATIGGFDLPAVVTNALESSFNAQSALLTSSLNVDSTHYDVSGISSSTNRLTLKLKRAP